MRQSRYQRYYNRGSQANWEAMKADDALVGASIARFFGYLALVVAGLLVAFVAAQLGAFHTVVMVILTSPLWGGAALLLTLCQPTWVSNTSPKAASAIKESVAVNRRQFRK
jgi:hypothetical protein